VSSKLSGFKRADAGVAGKESCRKHGIPDNFMDNRRCGGRRFGTFHVLDERVCKALAVEIDTRLPRREWCEPWSPWSTVTEHRP